VRKSQFASDFDEASKMGPMIQSKKRSAPSTFNNPNPRDRTSRNCPRDEYDEAAAYESYMNPEPVFRAGPGDSYDAA